MDCETARSYLGNRHKLYRAANCLYVFGNSLEDLDTLTNKARATLLSYGYKAVAPQHDEAALSNYMMFLPMAYDPNKDMRNHWTMAQLTWVQHIANSSPLLGRGVGTGNPGITAFNRGGEPLFYDPLSSRDRKKNGHMVLLGPTGAGKSATLVGMLSQVMALSRPRLFIIEAGNSFGLLCDWYESLGLSVNRVKITPQSDVRLSPFADSDLVISQAEALKRSLSMDVSDADEDDDDDDAEAQRDVLGEMEIIALLMITGGEEKEAAMIRRSDKRLIRDAIIEACQLAHSEGRPALTQDVRNAFYALARDDERVSEVKKKLIEMGDAIGLFCDGLNGKVFNRPGKSWPEADVTLIDLGMFAREGYEAHLSISAISALNMINNIAERDQHTERSILVTIDEAHIITTNPLLAPFLTKIVKMWRKLGAWLWSATQNMEDYPGAAKKMLNMVEWWVCLVMPKEEIGEIARFRSLTEEQKELLLSARKAPRKYTEGVVLAEGMEMLFRQVPPSLVLSLAMTEKEEKAQRAKIMREKDCSELQAAIEVAKRIDRNRGIAS
jgi:conjugative transfer ATPase